MTILSSPGSDTGVKVGRTRANQATVRTVLRPGEPDSLYGPIVRLDAVDTVRLAGALLHAAGIQRNPDTGVYEVP